jgi:UDP-N-acetylmuramoylalanine--D-glutamate ligase
MYVSEKKKQKIALSQLHVGVFGVGRSGLTTLDFLGEEKCDFFVINRGKPEEWWKNSGVSDFAPLSKCFAEDDPKAQEMLMKCDLILLSPGIPRTHPTLAKAVAKNIKIWSEIELAYHFCNCPIIAVTGTNGKTTTVTLIGEMLKAAGHHTFVGGNIGIPFCQLPLDEGRHPELPKYDVAVLELSSFQLESIEEFTPDVAVILNITMNHGERYDKLEEYAKAKFNITKNMLPQHALIYPRQVKIIDSWAQREHIVLLPFNNFLIQSELSSKFNLSNFKLKGDHNLENLYAAYKAINYLKLKEDGIQHVIEDFEGVHFRIEEIKQNKDNPKYRVFNDAKSTNLEATEKAILAVKSDNKAVYLIYGGQKRDRNEKYFLTSVFKNHLSKIFLIGETSDDMEKAFSDFPHEIIKSYTIEKAMESIDKENFEGVVLFSPGFPSFDQFKNYIDRGEKFNKLVESFFTLRP